MVPLSGPAERVSAGPAAPPGFLPTGGYAAALRRSATLGGMQPDRFHLALTVDGQQVMNGWWGSEETARRKFTRWIGEHSTMPGARVTLTDEETGAVLTTWPDGP